jgi:sulfide dehydrogenase cytochrome subunit
MPRWLLPALVCSLLQAGAARAADAPPGASSCSGCHTNSKAVNTAVPRLAGHKPADIASAMRDFKTGTRPATVMGRIAKGFSDPEIDAIAAWLAAQGQ